MATIASLIVNLGMNTASFTAGAKRGKSSLDMLSRSAFALNNVIGVAKEAGNVIGSVVDQFARQAEVIDDIGKFSDRTGFSTENIAALHHNAELSGVAVETLDAGLQKLSVNLGKAAQAGDKTDNAFTKIGLNVKELIALGPDAAFAKIADTIAAIDSPAAKSAAAVAIFGKSGAELLNILNQGSGGLAEMRAEADKLGLTFSRIDATSIEQANDELERASKIWQGIRQDLTVSSAPYIEALAVAFRSLATEIAIAQDFRTPAGGITPQ